MIIDEHTLFRVGWRLLMRDELPDVGLQEAVDLDDGERSEAAWPWPDLIALDVSGHGAAAVERVRRCRARWPQVPLVVLVDRDAPAVLPPLLSEGISGVVARTAQPAAVAQVLRVLLAGRLSRETVGLPTAGSIRWSTLAPDPAQPSPKLEPQQDPAGPAGRHAAERDPAITVPRDFGAAVRAELVQLGLSPRQLDVLRLLATGQSNKQIGRELGVAESTIKTHVLSLFQKLGVMSRTEAMLWAGARGLSGPMPPVGGAARDGLGG